MSEFVSLNLTRNNLQVETPDRTFEDSLLTYPEEELDALDVEVEVVFEEGDADVAEVPAALLVDHVDYVL